MPHLYVMFEDSENQLEYIFFKILVHVTCIVASDKFAIRELLCNTEYCYIDDTEAGCAQAILVIATTVLPKWNAGLYMEARARASV